MLSKLKKENKGFTIIEVLIVLAIAGLIILIVLLAVPALQRNSRNTGIKEDAANISGGVSEFASNNDGGVPDSTNSSQSGSSVSLNNASGTAVTAKIQGGTTYNDADTAAAGSTVTPSSGQLYVYFKGKCPSSVTSPVAISYNSRSTAIVYATETSGGSTQPRCLDS